MVVPEIVITSERETPVGLSFSARIEEGGSSRTVEIRLHWADYNLWSPDGADPPERVAMAALRFACSRMAPRELPASCDAATLRRMHADADAAVLAMLRRGP